MDTLKTGSAKYSTISLPMAIIKEIDQLIDERGYWPSRGSFVREACLEKIRVERKRLQDLKDATQKNSRGDDLDG